MSSIKRPDPKKSSNHNFSQFGLTAIPDDFDPTISLEGGDVDANDSDLEAELAAITGKNSSANSKSNSKPILAPENEFDNMIAESLKDVSDDDDDGDVENDTELLDELQGIVESELDEGNNEKNKLKSTEPESRPQQYLPTELNMVDLLKQRIEIYKIAEANAKTVSENSKMRRFHRGLKNLNDLLNQANLGKTINHDDIPPEVSFKLLYGDSTMELGNKAITNESQSQSPPLQKEKVKQLEKELVAVNIQVNPLVQQMRLRQQEYKAATLQSKRSGDTAMALQYLKIVKQFDVVIKMCEDGQDVDLSDMPPPPDQFKVFMENMAGFEQKPANLTKQTESSLVSEDESTIEHNINTTKMLEALIQRLNIYKSVEESSKADENYSKARRFGRIVKQYEDAIKNFKAGRSETYNELPVPPGFGPLPVENSKGATSPKVESKPSSQPTVSNALPTPDNSQTLVTKTPFIPPHHDDLTTRTSGNQQKNNLAEQQMKILLQRQKEFKIAAIEAKKAGEIDQAKEYLKIHKGFDALLNAASSGLPVDLNTVSLFRKT